MDDLTRKWLEDAITACHAIQGFVDNETSVSFQNSDLLQSAVERKFLVIAEALNRIRSADPVTSMRIHETRQIIAFRNRLVHNYDRTDPLIVWGIVEEDLPQLTTVLVQVRNG
jgi:uncharacterized protein with HEPN domain